MLSFDLKLTEERLVMFLQMYVGVPSGVVRSVPEAVISVQFVEHSRSTTTLPSEPEEEPVTLMSTGATLLALCDRADGSVTPTMNVRDHKVAGILFADVRRS